MKLGFAYPYIDSDNTARGYSDEFSTIERYAMKKLVIVAGGCFPDAGERPIQFGTDFSPPLSDHAVNLRNTVTVNVFIYYVERIKS